VLVVKYRSYNTAGHADGGVMKEPDSCCSALHKAMTEPPNSTFRIVGDGALFLGVGYARTETGVGWFEMAVKFCPFCGAARPTPQAVEPIEHERIH
jgi:hypothetical protein